VQGFMNGLNGWRTRPMYTFSEAAHLAGVSSATVRRWMFGYESPTGQMRPVFGPRDKAKEQGATVSFLQLAEIVVVGQFRHRRVKLERLRRAHSFARERFSLEYPFASLHLKTDGVHVLHEFQESEPGTSLLVLDQSGQLTLPGYVIEVIESFDFEKDLAARWFPLGKEVPIVIDPRYGAGRPTIPNRRLTIETIRKRWLAGQSFQFIAEDFDLEPVVVEDALRYAEKYAA
jgi:uncharacterized protein (DUF433 family)